MSTRSLLGLLLPCSVCIALLGCSDSTTDPLPGPSDVSLQVISGADQTGMVGEELPEPLVVRVTREAWGRTVGVPRQIVNFNIVEGGGSVFAGAALTDLGGYAREYWTLGPEPGANRLEVRAVDPTTGEKQLFAVFSATGLEPQPEVCNGVDDDLDGTIDDPSWKYCIDGTAAPNTDGANACVAPYQDLNGDPADGCEAVDSQPESCNGLDDDGDGVVDEGFPYCVDGAPAPGTDGLACDPGRFDYDGDPANGCEGDGTVDFCAIQFPTSVTAQVGEAFSVFARVYEEGLTEPEGPSALVDTEIGLAPSTADDPADNTAGWTFVSADFNDAYTGVSDDEYVAALTADAEGTWAVAARVRIAGGGWTYCDLDGSGTDSNGWSYQQALIATINP